MPSPLPPHNLEMEESALGAMLLNRESAIEGTQLLYVEDFYKPSYGHIFQAIANLVVRDADVDVVMVRDELIRLGLMESIGDASVLNSLTLSVPSPRSIAQYAEIVSRHANGRRKITALAEIKQAILAGDEAGEAKWTAVLDALGQDAASRDVSTRSRTVDGAAFVLDEPTEIEALWGRGDEALWVTGESFFVCGPTGVGKTTLAQRLALAFIGLSDEVLGWPVTGDHRVLYVAADRPAQARRSLKRMVGEEDREKLLERLVVHKGPLPFDLGKDDPSLLSKFARRRDCDTIVIDSLKDVAADLSKDETGSRINMAVQTAMADGLELLVLHHQRKEVRGGGKPKTLADVYGSTWITAGAGSVLLLWGDAGDPLVEVSHLKQPAEVVGPFTMLHDSRKGAVSVSDSADVLTILRGGKGLSASSVAMVVHATGEPSKNDVEKARRKLDRLVEDRLATRHEGRKGGAGGGAPSLYFAVSTLRMEP